MVKRSTGRITFEIINYLILMILTAVCLLPVIHILAVSFSSNTAAAAGTVKLWPIGFTTYSYEYVAGRKEFWHAVFKSLERVLIGVPLGMLLTIMIAYPLSKETSQFRMRTVYVWFFFFTMLFSGGLIPGYMLIQNLNMMDSIWALVLPVAVSVYNVVLMLNFFRGIPKELEEAAVIDGATQWQTCFRIYMPCAKPSIATLSLFTFVMHWNSWFDGLLFSNFSNSYPLASYLQTVVVRRDMTLIGAGDLQALMNISDRTVKSAQIFMGMLPIFLVYPFVQKHFVKGIVVGSVKG
ncbi:MAG: carbohydrate ABC transporter permease [Anaerocolumna sp.]